MKHLPNILSVLRIAGSIGLLFCDVTGWTFGALYPDEAGTIKKQLIS